MVVIRETTDYGMFAVNNINRDIVDTQKLEKSMEEHGWIDAYPAHVVRADGGKLRIKAGHHRFHVAKTLGIGIKYVVCDDSASIIQLEDATIKWSQRDYLVSYCRQGLRDYLVVKHYVDRTGIPIRCVVSMLGGHQAGSANFDKEFKDGAFKVKTVEHINMVASILQHMRENGVGFTKHGPLITAISKLMFVEELDVEEFKVKIKKFSYMLKRQIVVAEYLRSFETIYNKGRKEKVNISFIAEKAAYCRSRNICKLKVGNELSFENNVTSVARVRGSRVAAQL